MVRRRVAWFVGLAVFYEWLVVEATRDEAIAALIGALAGTALLSFVARNSGQPATVAGRGLLALVTHVPFSIVRETCDVLGPALWRAVAFGERAPGRWIALRYAGDDNARGDGYGRRTLVVFGSGLTPNACPLAVDDDAERLYLHQLVWRRESAAGRPEYPL